MADYKTYEDLYEIVSDLLDAYKEQDEFVSELTAFQNMDVDRNDSVQVKVLAELRRTMNGASTMKRQIEELLKSVEVAMITIHKREQNPKTPWGI